MVAYSHTIMASCIFVGLSGGVDSSVAAKRLIDRGYNVIGVFIKTWQPDFITCNVETERLDAMRVAAHLNIPFLTFDAEEVYKRDVADYMISEYSLGRTPNPDVMCNRHVKFGAFLEFAKKHGASHVATGHYARILKNGDNFALYRGVDNEKDQSYFLWTLTKEQLETILLPIGDSTKAEIREEARKAGLPTSEKKDSQGVCFLGKIDMKDFLSHYIKSNPGTVVDEDGNIIGSHTGALYFTIGQRHGFIIHNADQKTPAYYVIQKNLDTNTLVVSSKPTSSLGKNILLTDLVNRGIHNDGTYEAQYRYRQKPFSVKVSSVDAKHAILQVHDQDVGLPSVGQSCVFYRNDACLGGGIIDAIT